MREALRDDVILAVTLWNRDSSCGCYPMCVSCARLTHSIEKLMEFEGKKVVTRLTQPVASMVDPPESSEAMGDDSDFEDE